MNFSTALKRIFSQPAFVVAVVVLAIGAVGLNAAVEALQLHFKKLPVPLPKGPESLAQLPEVIGHWRQVSKDRPLSHDIEDVLGTDQYIMRTYVNTQIVAEEDLAKFKDKSADDRDKLAGQLNARHPDAVVRLSLTYYTGLFDTVAHIPERCIIADGYEVKPGFGTDPEWAIGGPEGSLQVRFLNFEDQAGRDRVDRNVTYFFHCNGKYTSSTIDVRKQLANLFQRYGYYAKIETMTLLKDPETAEKVMTDFLSSTLPEIEKLLPDWKQFEKIDVK